MNERRLRFCHEYVVDMNATKAAIRAGYSKRTASQNAHNMLQIPEIAAKVAELKAKVTNKLELKAEDVVEQMRRLAFGDIRGFYHPDGRLKQPHELDAEHAACVAGFEVIIKNAEAGDGKTDTVHKYKLVDKRQPVQDLMKYFGLLKTAEVNVNVNVAEKAARLEEGRQRARSVDGSPRVQ